MCVWSPLSVCTRTHNFPPQASLTVGSQSAVHTPSSVPAFTQRRSSEHVALPTVGAHASPAAAVPLVKQAKPPAVNQHVSPSAHVSGLSPHGGPAAVAPPAPPLPPPPPWLSSPPAHAATKHNEMPKRAEDRVIGELHKGTFATSPVRVLLAIRNALANVPRRTAVPAAVWLRGVAQPG